jgi:hypothetical protein
LLQDIAFQARTKLLVTTSVVWNENRMIIDSDLSATYYRRLKEILFMPSSVSKPLKHENTTLFYYPLLQHDRTVSKIARTCIWNKRNLDSIVW